MKRIAILSLLLVPSAAVGVEQASAQAPTRVASHFDSQEDLYGDQSIVRGQSCEPGLCAPAACASQGGWFGDIGYYVLKPQWGGGNPAAAVSAFDAVGDELLVEQEDFDHDHDFAPLVQIGFAGPKGLGVRARWWKLDSSDRVGASFDPADFPGVADVEINTPSLLGAGDFFEVDAILGDTAIAGARHSLDLDVIDMEALWATTIGRTSVLYSAGVRYAHVGQHFTGDVAVSDAAGGVLEEGTFHGSNTFNGAGPTISMQAYRGIGCSDFSVYGLGRGSVLFGERREHAASTTDFGLGAFTRERDITNDAVLPVIEVEAGVNWTRNMGGFDLFAESGFVGQVWFDAGNAANSDSILSQGAFGASDNANQDMGLVGVRYSTGVRF